MLTVDQIVIRHKLYDNRDEPYHITEDGKEMYFLMPKTFELVVIECPPGSSWNTMTEDNRIHAIQSYMLKRQLFS